MKTALLVSEAKAVGGAEIYLERLVDVVPGWETRLAIPRRPALRAWLNALSVSGRSPIVYSTGVRGLLGLAAKARADGIDLIHVNLPSSYDGHAGLLPWALGRVSGKPVVVTEHLTRIPRSRRRRWMKHRTASAILTRVVVSEASREGLTAEGFSTDSIVVVPNGVPDPGLAAPLPDFTKGLRVGVLATLEPRKQIDVLLKAAAMAPAASMTISVAGEGPLRQELERLAGHLGVADRVEFLGRVEDPYSFLEQQHLLALSSRLEGMPLVVLEAFASGRGVLASDLPGMAELVEPGKTGKLLPPGDVEAWAGALVEAAGSPAEVAEWGQAGRRIFETRFTLAAMAEKTARVYDAAVQARVG